MSVPGREIQGLKYFQSESFCKLIIFDNRNFQIAESQSIIRSFILEIFSTAHVDPSVSLMGNHLALLVSLTLLVACLLTIVGAQACNSTAASRNVLVRRDKSNSIISTKYFHT